MKINFLVYLFIFACYFTDFSSVLSAQDVTDFSNHQTDNIEDVVLSPIAVPVATQEDAIIANQEAITAKKKSEKQKKLFEEEQKKAKCLEMDDWNKIDFGKKYFWILLCLVPFSILFSFILKKRIRLHFKTKTNQETR